MPKYRPYSHLDVFWASTVAALEEFIGLASINFKLSMPNNTTVRVAASANNGQASIGVEGLWRYRSSNYDLAISGGAEIKDIYAVAVTGNSFADTPQPDTDNTDYNFELRFVSHNAAAPGSVAASRKIAEIDWDGSKITGLRQFAGSNDQSAQITPTAPNANVPAVRAIGAAGQSAPIMSAETTGGTVKWTVDASGNTVAAGSMTAQGGVIITDGQDVTIGTVTGTKIGQSGSKIGLWGAAPIARPAAYTNSSGLTGNRTLPGSYDVNDLAKWVIQIQTDLKNIGILQ